jgi:Flp pilus assembly pilin Flp
MYRLLRQFATDEQGQDLLEFTLMLAFVFLASAALWVSSR